MHRSPELSRTELDAEDRVTAPEWPSDDPQLAADRALRHELHGLDESTLPTNLRTRIMKAARRRQQPGWWMGLAAAVFVGLAVALFIEPLDQSGDSPRVTESDLQELHLALASLELGARRAGSATSSQLGQSVITTQINLQEVPYAQHFKRWIQPYLSTTH